MPSTRIGRKLKAEEHASSSAAGSAASKKGGGVDVFRGGKTSTMSRLYPAPIHLADTYQFGYWIKKGDSHTVMIKVRSLNPFYHSDSTMMS